MVFAMAESPFLLPHYLGLAGELLNLAGASALAWEMRQRRSLRRQEDELDAFHLFGIKHALRFVQVEGVRLTQSDFRNAVIDGRTLRTWYGGMFCLIGGFMLLAAYHGAEIWHLLR